MNLYDHPGFGDHCTRGECVTCWVYNFDPRYARIAAKLNVTGEIPTPAEKPKARASTSPPKTPPRKPASIQKPGLFRRLRTFTRALWSHIRHGLPTASPASRAARQTICDHCEWQDKEQHVCRKCGCVQKQGALLDKLSFARESCPLSPPKWGPVKGETLWSRARRFLLRR